MKTVILGASRGLGLVLCEYLAKAGHQVLAGARVAVPPALLALTRQYPAVKTVLLDVANEAEMENAAEVCRKTFGEVDNVIFVAGILMPEDRVSLLHELPPAVLRETFEVNTFGAISAIRHFYPLVRKNADSAFILITSEGCDIDAAGSWIPAYSLSKCAETKVAKIMNESVSDVRFYAVHPGRMKTDMGYETWDMSPEETAAGLTALLENGNIHRKGHWYMDYLGNSMI